jgi:Domain of unknown function (DUF4837)
VQDSSDKEKTLRRIKYLSGLCIFVALGILSGCQDVLSGLKSKPTALGVMNEIVVISDDVVWEGQAGDSLMYYFASPYPIMPAPEPLFDLRHYTPNHLEAEALRKELRTYLILADLSDKGSPTTKMVRKDLGEEIVRKYSDDPDQFTTAGVDKWARGQLVIYIMGNGQDDLANNIIRAFPRISRRVREHDNRQLDAQTYMNGSSTELTRLIAREFGIKLKVPGDFKVAIDDDNFLWIRRDNREVTSSIVIKSFPYKDKSQMQLEGLIDMRNRIGVLIEGTQTGSVMRTNNEDLPVYTYQKDVAGRYAIESRGIWEMTKDYLGGPFINFAVIDGDRIIVIDAFVYAPGKDKRDYIQQLELVIASLGFVG